MMLGKRFVWGVKFLFGLSRGGRNFTIFPDDVYLVSYPRSGNTWTRFLIANLLSPDEPATFANIESRIPDVYKNTKRQLERIPRPRILKSHEYFDPRYKRVIYIVRDPRDIVVSYYHFNRKTRVIPENYPFDLYVRRFIAGEVDLYASWMENVTTWLATRQQSRNFLLLRYEDMLQDPPRELVKVATFLGINRTPQQLVRAADLASAANMRKMEKQQADVWVNTRTTRKDIPFVRNAVAGGWKSALTPEMIDEIQLAWGPIMVRLGYELVTRRPFDVSPVSATPSWVG